MSWARIENQTAKIITFGVASSALFISPWISLDASSLPKFTITALCIAVLVFFLPYFKIHVLKTILDRNLFPVYLLPLFCIIIFLIHNVSAQSLYGKFGRNTGLLLFINLFILLLVSIFVSTKLKDLLPNVIVGVAFLNMIYGTFQSFSLDLVDWDQLGNPMIGTLGNSNFFSAYLGIASIFVLSKIMHSRGSRILVPNLIILSTFLLSIWRSDSIQGLVVFLIGTVLLVYFKFISNLGSFYKVSFGISAFITSIISIGGLFSYGPLSTYLYQETAKYRQNYWSTAWEMFRNRPFFGYGFDSYGDWYTLFRSSEVVTDRGPQFVSNSSHNLFLDLAVNGGIFILIPFAWLVFLCFKSLASNFKESNSYNPEKVTIFAGWLGYLSQSLISVNQISLAVVGWSLTGVIIGNSKYYLQAIREVDDEIQSQKQFRWKVRVQSGIVAIILCLIAVPPFVQDFKFKKALSSGSAEKLSNASLFWPRNIYYLNMGSQLLRQNNLQEMAIVLSRMSVKINDRNIAGYLEIISNSSISEEEKLATLRHIRSLDPFSNLYVAVD